MAECDDGIPIQSISLNAEGFPVDADGNVEIGCPDDTPVSVEPALEDTCACKNATRNLGPMLDDNGDPIVDENGDWIKWWTVSEVTTADGKTRCVYSPDFAILGQNMDCCVARDTLSYRLFGDGNLADHPEDAIYDWPGSLIVDIDCAQDITLRGWGDIRSRPLPETVSVRFEVMSPTATGGTWIRDPLGFAPVRTGDTPGGRFSQGAVIEDVAAGQHEFYFRWDLTSFGGEPTLSSTAEGQLFMSADVWRLECQ